jgi:magnesium transporter
MISGYALHNGGLRLVDDPVANIGQLVWLDLVAPSAEEEALLEDRFGLDIPTREEMEEIEVSSRLYQEDGASFMTAALPARADGDDLLVAPVTFVLWAQMLITVRYHEPRAFKTFPKRASQADLGCTDGRSVLISLLDAIVDRVADILERIEREVDAISREIFRTTVPSKERGDLMSVLQLIGRKGDVCSNLLECLLTLQRLSGFFAFAVGQRSEDRDLRGRIKTLSRDLQSLSDHSVFLAQKVTFLLDATLGMINIEQNNIIKIFSIAAGVFLPPTLIASIYGMNFAAMPELNWALGYPLALALMVLSGILPLWYFKRRGWL